jgi:hypothetical protein
LLVPDSLSSCPWCLPKPPPSLFCFLCQPSRAKRVMVYSGAEVSKRAVRDRGHGRHSKQDEEDWDQH